jgi:NAD(P)-dependent dehydrogenase (short-subunit alcohol dehydrogenase family)
VVANAGICIPNPRDHLTGEIFRSTLDINVTGIWNTVIVGAPHLTRADGGSIVLTSSVAGLKTVSFMVNHTASKSAVTGMGKAFAAELAQHGIRVYTVHPGGVRTAMGTGRPMEIIGAMEDNRRIAGMMGNMLPIDAQQPEDIAATVLLLAAEESKCVTAQAMAVDAGASQN